MSDETPTRDCLACRAPIPLGGVEGDEVPVTCARCGTVHTLRKTGDDIFRWRLGARMGGLLPDDGRDDRRDHDRFPPRPL